LVESETFDLAGSTVSTIEHAIRDAFAQPFPLHEMIRLTFVTGAGKLGRAKYDENAARAVTSTLRDLGYEEDRGASAVLECAGTFKLQHDTGKNLKTVVVFPKVTSTGGLERDGGNVSGNNELGVVSMIAADSIEQKLAQATMNTFPRMMESKCETWSQKRGCSAALTTLKSLAESLDSKLMNGKPLTDPEQEYYNSVSLTSLEDKLTCVRELMAKQVDSGHITIEEKKQLLEQVTDRLETLGEEIAEAEANGKAKRVENLKAQQLKAKERQTKIQSLSTIPPPKLKHDDAIMKLRKEQLPLLEIEQAAKGRLLTLKESLTLARKDEILNEIQELELSSRNWFESDETFQTRVKASQMNCEKQLKQMANKKKAAPKAGSSNASSTSASSKWVVPGAKKSSAWTKPVTKSIPTGGGLFAAMMNDSDSD
jgi:hypothetical protein